MSTLSSGGWNLFFTVNLLERHPKELLVRHVEVLRAVVRKVRAKWPFYIDAWVVLPDHMHCVWTLPLDDADYANLWRLIKSKFKIIKLYGAPKKERR